MCGIFCCVLSPTSDRNLPEIDSFSRIKRRGPDSWCSKTIQLSNGVRILFAGSVLHLQGEDLIKQPIFNDNTALLWNGEIFDGFSIPQDQNDTQFLFDKLNAAESPSQVVDTLAQIRGPWAFVYLDKRQRLWYGRDFFGRRSLLSEISNDQVILSSVVESCDVTDWNEVTADGIYYIDLELSFSIKNYKWKTVTNCETPNATDLLIPNPIKTSLNSDVKIPNSLNAEDFDIYTNDFYRVLLKSIQNRALITPSVCRSCYNAPHKPKCHHCKIAVLFSGGVDSSVLAALLDKCVDPEDPIDLINVAFEQKTDKRNSKTIFDVPDRITGREALIELKKISTNRTWNFIEVDVKIDELKTLRSQRIASLINPAISVLDDSIGSAIWFAARGEGNLDGVSYVTSARVLVLGMGADEQLAGYSRHRRAFMENGWKGLLEELEVDINRISHRNLGRDDRVVSDHGRESRYPFLDEGVVDFLNEIPVWVKADLRLARGVGEKLLLRSLARRIGLQRVSEFSKRAIQFGTRIANMEGKGEKGNHVCNRLR